MKKTILFLIFSAALMTQNIVADDKLSVSAELGYSTEHNVRGLNYSDDSVGIGLNVAHDLGFAQSFGAIYNIPRSGDSDSVNHTVFGLSRGVDLGSLSFTGIVQVQHINADVDSTDLGVGAVFDQLPLVGDWANVGLTLWDNHELDYTGLVVDISVPLEGVLMEELKIEPYADFGNFDEFDYIKLGVELSLDWGEWTPFVDVYHLDGDNTPLVAEDGWNVQTGFRYAF